MRKDLTDITLVVDRSGSMEAICSDAEGGINHFIEDQRKQPGSALLTLVQFDTEYDFIHKGVPITDVPAYTLQPRGATALLDAVGRAIAETGARLQALPEEQRPGLVVFVVVTDGQENSSREYKLDQIKAMIEHQTTKYGWQFTFLAANQDAFASGASMGFAVHATATVAPAHMDAAYRAATSNVTRMRSSTMAGMAPTNTYTVQERAAMAGADVEDEDEAEAK